MLLVENGLMLPEYGIIIQKPIFQSFDTAALLSLELVLILHVRGTT